MRKVKISFLCISLKASARSYVDNQACRGKRAECKGSFSSAASTSHSTKVNTCVLKSAAGLGATGTRTSFTESSGSARGAYIETQRSCYFQGTRCPQIEASPHLCSSLLFSFYATGCCLILTVVRYFRGTGPGKHPRMQHIHQCQLCAESSLLLLSGC